jgi:hypothetical protein
MLGDGTCVTNYDASDDQVEDCAEANACTLIADDTNCADTEFLRGDTVCRTAIQLVSDGGGIVGSGTSGRIAKFTGAGNSIDDSQIFEDGDNEIGIGTTLPDYKLHVVGTVNATDFGCLGGNCISGGDIFEGGLNCTQITGSATLCDGLDDDSQNFGEIGSGIATSKNFEVGTGSTLNTTNGRFILPTSAPANPQKGDIWIV